MSIGGEIGVMKRLEVMGVYKCKGLLAFAKLAERSTLCTSAIDSCMDRKDFGNAFSVFHQVFLMFMCNNNSLFDFSLNN